MGMFEVVMLAIMGHMVVLGMEIGMQMVPGYRVCRWTKLSHLQHFVHTHNTQPFYCWSGICPGPPGSAGTRKVKPRRLKPIWIYWSKR